MFSLWYSTHGESCLVTSYVSLLYSRRGGSCLVTFSFVCFWYSKHSKSWATSTAASLRPDSSFRPWNENGQRLRSHLPHLFQRRQLLHAHLYVTWAVRLRRQHGLRRTWQRWPRPWRAGRECGRRREQQETRRAGLAATILSISIVARPGLPDSYRGVWPTHSHLPGHGWAEQNGAQINLKLNALLSGFCPLYTYIL